jgi:DNA replication protein DnaC
MSYETNHGVGRRFRQATLSQLDKEYFGDVLDYAKNYRQRINDGEGLLLSGPSGIGKTYAIVALQRYIKEKEGGRFDYFVVTAPKFFDNYAVRNSDEADTFRGKPMTQTYETVTGMVLNDLGKEERIKDWQEEVAVYKLGRLLRARHEEQLPIFITTNFPLRSRNAMTFQGAYGKSVWSLVQEMTHLRLEITAPDRRAEKATRVLGEDE